MAKQNAESIGIDLKGRVNSLKLAERNTLFPLFEAIINSIQAIEDAKISDGKIVINIVREQVLEFEKSDTSKPSVQDFIVIDNGIGFNDENYNSFKRAYSTYKSDRGGKGIGRFIWLKAFQDVHIESIYYKQNKTFHRTFKFNLINDNGINSPAEKLHEGNPTNETRVKLFGYKEPYKSRCPKKIETIAVRIIEHCLIYFLRDNCPSIILTDGSEEVDLNVKYAELILGNCTSDKFTIRNEDYKITLIKWFEHEEITYNRISLCANHREVEDFNINKVFHDLNGKIYDSEKDEHFLILGYVESLYLDNNVNDERTEISFSKDGLFDSGLINRHELYAGIEPIVRSHFGNIINEYKNRKLVAIQKFISETAPQYKILEGQEAAFDNIVITDDTSEKEIDLKLYKAYQEYDFKSREEIQQILSCDIPDDGMAGAVREKYLKVLHNITALNKTKLAQYVVHRKLILELFEKSLEVKENGKYELEKTVHDIVFPTRMDSDELNYEDQNLWLIDERLSFHTYLTSDKSLNSIAGLDTNSTVRPDLLIFNNPISFIEGDSEPFNSIILIEFKRPMRDKYDPERDNPIEQVYDYVKDIRSAKQITRKGRHYSINSNTWFYIYLICDINEKIERWASYAQLSRTHDGVGFYGYNKDLHSMIEIIPFNQLLANAKKRNKVLFTKLGI